MSSWKECKLGDVAKFSYGTMPKKEKLDTGIYPTFSGYKYQYLYPEINCKKNDVIVVARGVGGTGDVKIVREDCYLTNLSIKIDLNNSIVDNKFFYYNYFLETLRYLDSGSAQSQITITDLSNEYISLPPLEEQKAIAEVLSSLDDKIDLLHRQNQTLESLAQTLFRQWFIEEAKEEWEEKPLGKVTNIAIGRTPPRKEEEWFSIDSKDVKWISIKDLGNDGAFIFKTSEYLTQEAIERFNVPVIPKDTVVLSFKMTVGRVAITTESMLSNEAIAHFKFNDKTPISKEYLYLFLKTFPYESLGSTSSIVTAINSAMIKEMMILIPDEKTIKDFSSIVEPQFEKIRQNQQQIQTLENLRDTLLPKLLSGEIRVKFDN